MWSATSPWLFLARGASAGIKRNFRPVGTSLQSPTMVLLRSHSSWNRKAELSTSLFASTFFLVQSRSLHFTHSSSNPTSLGEGITRLRYPTGYALLKHWNTSAITNSPQAFWASQSSSVFISRRMQSTGTKTGEESKDTEKPADEKEKEGEKGKEEKAKEGEDEAQQEKREWFYEKIKKDIGKYPDIYNSLNGMHFLLFLVFCLVSTASPAESNFWKNHCSVSDRFRPLAWAFHSLVTENFMAMAYSMMMLHKLCVQMYNVWGLKRVQAFVGLTAVISGAVMWLGNYGYYQLYMKGKAGHVPEFQYGPWDVIYGLLFAQYLHVAIHPIRTILSFDHWLKYASGVGTLFIWYFDWQPTLVGSIVGVVLCKTVPAFKVVPVKV